MSIGFSAIGFSYLDFLQIFDSKDPKIQTQLIAEYTEGGPGTPERIQLIKDLVQGNIKVNIDPTKDPVEGSIEEYIPPVLIVVFIYSQKDILFSTMEGWGYDFPAILHLDDNSEGKAHELFEFFISGRSLVGEYVDHEYTYGFFRNSELKVMIDAFNANKEKLYGGFEFLEAMHQSMLEIYNAGKDMFFDVG